MSLKMKLTSIVIAIGLVFSMLVIGVLSVKKVDIKLGGKIEFNAEGIELTLSDGHLNNEEAYTGATAIGDKMKGIEITTFTSKEIIANALSTWNGIDLTFVKNESGEGVKANSITFSITNDSSEFDIAVDIEVTTTGINSENVKITPIGMNTIHRSDVENYEIKFELLDNELSTNITSYDITFNFTKYDENAPVILNDAGESEALLMAFKTTDDATATAKVEGMTIAGTAQLDSYTGSESSVRIPAYVQKGDNIYEVRSIKDGQYQGWGYVGTFGQRKSYGDPENTKLQFVTIPNTVNIIGIASFSDCSNLTTINIPNGVQTIKSGSFNYCRNLSLINLPKSLTTIEEKAFYNCNSLTAINITDGVGTIESYAFENCYSLTSIEIPSSITTIGHSVFTGCSGLESISVNQNNTNYMSEGNALLNKEGTELIRGCKNTIIPSSVQTIRNSAFNGCNSLTSINIPEGVKTIDYGAFSGCSGLTKIKIPSSVTAIGGTGNATFERCTNLKTIIIDSPEVAVKLNKCNIYSIENGLLQDRETIYILSSIENADNLSSLISKGFSYAGVGEGEYAGYQKYVIA